MPVRTEYSVCDFLIYSFYVFLGNFEVESVPDWKYLAENSLAGRTVNTLQKVPLFMIASSWYSAENHVVGLLPFALC